MSGRLPLTPTSAADERTDASPPAADDDEAMASLGGDPWLPRVPADRLLLNFSGHSYAIRLDCLERRGEGGKLTRFARLPHAARLALADGYIELSGEYYFDRPARIVEPILDFYTTGHLHKPVDLCWRRFTAELCFWAVPLSFVSRCCAPVEDKSPTESPSKAKSRSRRNALLDKNEFEGLFMGRLRRRLWDFMEVPTSSCGAKLFSFVSVSFVVASVTGLVLASMPEFQTVRTVRSVDNSSGSATTSERNETESAAWLEQMEWACIVWFCAEYVSRLAVSASTLAFVRTPMNVIDLAAILPFFAEICLPLFGVNAERLRRFAGAMLVVRALRVLRVARVFKLARYSSGLQTFADTMRKSVSELSMLGMFMVTGIIFFSALMHSLEQHPSRLLVVRRDHDNGWVRRRSSDDSWQVVQLDGSGGEASAAGGKMVATMASVCGIIVLAFPISMIVEKFSTTQEGAQADADADADDGPRLVRSGAGKIGGSRKKRRRAHLPLL